MIVYHYDRTTKEFLDSSEARLNPVETEMQGKEVYLIPAWATKIESLTPGKNEVSIFINDTWEIQPDFRDSKYYLSDGTEIIIENIGETIPSGALLEPPIIPPTEEELIEQKIGDEMRNLAIESLKIKGEIPPDY